MEYRIFRKLILLLLVGCSGAELEHNEPHFNHRQPELEDIYEQDNDYNHEHSNENPDEYDNNPEGMAPMRNHEHIAGLHGGCNHNHGELGDNYGNPEHMGDGNHQNQEYREHDNGNDRKSEDCALRLDRSFAPQDPNPLLGGREHYAPKAQNMKDCITYNDINRAFNEAKKIHGHIVVQRPLYDMAVVKIYELATILIETTKIISRRYQLNWREINDLLPTIDTSKTDIWDICPEELKPTPCNATRFRSIDGRCSSLQNSVLGATNTAIIRALYPQYDDGIDAARSQSVAGGPLPNVRVVSVQIHQDFSSESFQNNDLFMSWAQFLGHDLTSQGTLLEVNGTSIECCPRRTHPLCAPVHIPEDDPFYSRFGQRCLLFTRTVPALRPGCALGPRLPLNMLTTRLDAGFIYGHTEEKSIILREGVKGILKMWDKFHDLGLKKLPPLQTAAPEKECIREERKLFCFMSGDDRANIQVQAIVIHTLYTRYHNTMAKQLANLNPHWDDERIYQETRHIMAAVVQHIAFNEFLPIALGPKYLRMYNLTLSEGYWDGYDYNTPMVTLLPFQSAAFRFGHTMVNTKVRLYNKKNQLHDSMDFHKTFLQPFMIYQPGTVDKVISGFLNAPAEDFDRFMTTGLTEHLFQTPKEHFGLDLASLNMNRGRDHGMPGYNEYREWCGLPRIKTFEELDQYLGNGTGVRYSKIYKHPDDIDLWSASLAEPAVEGGVVGPTFACIIGRQFSILRKADHFWYENPGFPSSFTPGQLREIKKMTQSKITCENADDIPTIQMWAMVIPDEKRNPRVPCKDIPSINLEYWTEDPVKKTFVYQ